MRRRGMTNLGVLAASSFAIYLVLSIVIAVGPGAALSRTAAGPGVSPLSAAEQRGRDIYVGEGCSYCHTQQVRPLEQDRPWGRPSTRGDFAYDTPQLLGDERTGPDLSNVGARQPSNVWNFIHLYEPRSVVSASIMPAYPWLFQAKDHAAPGDVTVPVPPGFAPAGKVVVPTQRAQDLVAYLLSLKQAELPKAAP